jgi:CRISPR-associated endonuclease/helicase Cas3
MADCPMRCAEGAALDKRLLKSVEVWRHGLSGLPTPTLPQTLPLPPDAFAASFFVRMVFSCLVDADYLDTEAFMRKDEATLRGAFPSLGKLHDRFFQALEKHDSALPINAIRAEIRRDCERKADLSPGFFTLTVPTGGGKTLSSLAFGLKHAVRHGLSRILYVAPFTSIIEQNAEVFRERLGADSLIEHHSNVDPEKETKVSASGSRKLGRLVDRDHRCSVL